MFEDELKRLRAKGLLRHILSRTSAQGPVITIDSRRYVNFSSNDYLGLANHPSLIQAAIAALNEFGAGAGASRLICGGSVLHRKLEEKVAQFKGTESALIFNSGYSANTSILPAITTEHDIIFSDTLNHASIIDGCRLSRAATVIYRHRDVSHLTRLLNKEKGKKRLVVTDSVFSMDGDIAPLAALCEVCKKHDAMLYIDDAHGTGVLGNGKGALAHFGIAPEPWIIQMGTFSKALGSFGAFVAGSRDCIEWIVNSARGFIFSTALPPAVIAMSSTALDLIQRDQKLIKKLWTCREMLFEILRENGYTIGETGTPIIPVMTGNIRETIKLAELLFSKGIYAPAIRPPAVIKPRIRFTITAAHSKMHIQKLAGVLSGLC